MNNTTLNHEGTVKLIAGVIKASVKDYIRAWKKCKKEGKDPMKNETIQEIRDFFLESNDMLDYIGMDGDYFLRKIHEMIDNDGKLPKSFIKKKAS